VTMRPIATMTPGPPAAFAVEFVLAAVGESLGESRTKRTSALVGDVLSEHAEKERTATKSSTRRTGMLTRGLNEKWLC